jgi:hypothetical protein
MGKVVLDASMSLDGFSAIQAAGRLAEREEAAALESERCIKQKPEKLSWRAGLRGVYWVLTQHIRQFCLFKSGVPYGKTYTACR